MMYFLQGLTIGLAYVAPIGVQNLFVINTGLTQSRARVYLTALIVIFFDITLSVACFFGIGALMDHFRFLKMAILLIGSIVILIMGIKLILEKASMDTGTNVNVPIVEVITMACVVTWFNPQALIDGSLLLGAFKGALPATESTKFILGVATASFCWFMGVSTVTHFFRSKFNDKILKIINVICGIVIVFYGLKLGLSFFKMF
ncbi:MAG: LysE family transporter [Anaerovorax sp.]|nr:LysE family transporter [Anaerovorax sp.]